MRYEQSAFLKEARESTRYHLMFGSEWHSMHMCMREGSKKETVSGFLSGRTIFATLGDSQQRLIGRFIATGG